MAGSLVAVSNVLSKYKLELVGVREVRWEGDGSEPAGGYTFLYGRGNENHELGTSSFVHKRIISEVKRALSCDRMSYILHAPTEDEIDDVKDSFCEEL
jgi:hypothetical protein